MLILRGVIAKKREQHRTLKLEQDLNSILNEWQWENKPCANAQEFITKMRPWVSGRIKEQKEFKEFLKKFGLKKLSEIKEVKR